MKKYVMIMILVCLFLMGFSYSTKVFSEEEMFMRIVQNSNGNDIVKVFVPSHLENIYLEVYQNDQVIAGIHLDYYSLEKINGRRKNTFILQTDFIKDESEISFMLFPGSEREETFKLNDLETIHSNTSLKEDTTHIQGVKVMSFNIHHGKSRLGLYNLNGVMEIVKDNQVDIVGLQEVDKNVYRSKFSDQVRLMATELGMYYAFGANIKIMGMEYGNAILSRYPIESVENIQLPGFKEKRGLLLSKVQIDNRNVNFLVTHLGLTKQEKVNQVKLIKKYIQFLGERTILVGDFNSNESSEEINSIKEVLVDSAQDEEGRFKHTYDGLVIKSRIDYIFASPDFRIRNYEVLDSNISDHFPLIAELEF